MKKSSFFQICCCLLPALVGMVDPAGAQERVLKIDVPERVSKIAFSPDGETLAILQNTHGDLRLVNANTGEETYRLDKPMENNNARNLLFAPDGRHLIFYGYGNKVAVFSLSGDGRELLKKTAMFTLKGSLSEAMALAEDKPFLACHLRSPSRLAVYNYETGEPVFEANLDDFNSSFYAIHLSRNGGQALMVSFDQCLLVDLEKGRVVQRMALKSVREPVFDVDGLQLASISHNAVTVIDVQNGKQREFATSDVARVAFGSAKDEFVMLTRQSIEVRGIEDLIPRGREEFTQERFVSGTQWAVSRNGEKAAVVFREKVTQQLRVIDLTGFER